MAKKKKEQTPNVHEDLDGLDISINEFGEIKTNYKVDRINKFLDENVDDKKLRDRADRDTGEEE